MAVSAEQVVLGFNVYTLWDVRALGSLDHAACPPAVRIRAGEWFERFINSAVAVVVFLVPFLGVDDLPKCIEAVDS